MAHPVQHDLCHRPHAVPAFAAGFVIGGLGQAIEISRRIERAGQTEGHGRDRAGQTNPAQAGVCLPNPQLFQTGGHELGLSVALGSPGDGIGIMPTRYGQGAFVETTRGGRQRFLGEAGGCRPLNPLGLGPHGGCLGRCAAEIGTADRQPHQRAERRRRRSGPNPDRTICRRRHTRMRG